MMRRLLFSGLLLAAVLVALPAQAKTGYTFKYDQFSNNLSTAAVEMAAEPLSVQMGFVKTEGFGQIYRPTQAMFPVELLGVDVFVAAPPNMAKSSAHVKIEIWFHDGADANPGKDAPDFVLSTRDLLGSGPNGAPLTGGSATSIDFDWSVEEGHPAIMNSGAFTVMVRFDEDAADLQTAWGELLCSKIEGMTCGCQQIGAIVDKSITNDGNVMHILSGGCSGAASYWTYAPVAGDFVLRVRANVNQACVPNCSGGKNCGLDGCGGSCGTCDEGWSCTLGICKEDEVCQPACTGKDCGDDGCGGSCGLCDEGEDCQAGACVSVDTDTVSEDSLLPEEDTLIPEDTFTPEDTLDHDACVPNCTDRVCGSDGCGSQCGACEGELICQGGACVEAGEVLAPLILTVSPDSVYNNVNTKISITGKNFGTVKLVKLGAVDLFNPVTISSGLMEATVPEGVAPGYYDIIAVFDDEQTAVLSHGLEVLKKKSGGGGGCTSSPAPTPTLPLLLLVLAALALARRKLA